MTTAELLDQIKQRLTQAHGRRLTGVVLYGSEALVLLEEPIDYGRDLQANLDALYPLSLEIGRRISAKPVSRDQYETVDCPLYRQAHREGIAA